MTTDEFSTELQELIVKGIKGGLHADEIEVELEAAIEALEEGEGEPEED